jgi:hypothetical protein
MSNRSWFFAAMVAIAAFVVGYFVAVPLRGGLITALQPILTTPAAAAAVIAAAVTLLVGLLTLTIGARQVRATQTSADAAMMTAANAGTRALASVRLDWLKDLRDTLSEYHSILMSENPNGKETTAAAKEKAEAADNRQLSYLGTKLDLLLNQEKKYQKALWQVSDDILQMGVETATDDEIDEADKRLVEAARNVLDFHWRKIKAEILGKPPLKEPAAQGSDA